MIKYFGYKEDQVFTEFLILKIVIRILAIATCIYLIGENWEFATDSFEVVYDQLIHGVHFADMTVYPTRIITGIVVFCSLYLVCRAVSTSISRHQQFEDEEETQVAIASILSYIGFTIALISGFLIAGFNFTGLAIIAGALSVGIGLGLQSIVNNFVSGLILLIEKPIRPGDRINVEGIEGFVKKIRVRSTQIMTPSREDIIIPNSDLITRPVKNYMYSDRYCHINCDVNVSYGTDTLLVRDVLLDIMNNHEEVLKTGRSKPSVLLRSIGNGALEFQFGCLIKDVNKKSIVQSELNFAIEQAFRDHHIELSSSQRDVNIKLENLTATAMLMEDNR
jgi:small-conductance mechanosensitive channel